MSDDTFARRFYGDRADLQKIGIEIRALGEAESADTQMYCLFEEDYRLPSLDFTPDERRALALVLATLEGRFAYARPFDWPSPPSAEASPIPCAMNWNNCRWLWHPTKTRCMQAASWLDLNRRLPGVRLCASRILPRTDQWRNALSTPTASSSSKDVGMQWGSIIAVKRSAHSA
jgi:hypothetical protein